MSRKHIRKKNSLHRTATEAGRASGRSRARAEKHCYYEEKDWIDDEDEFPEFSTNRIRKVDSRDKEERQLANTGPIKRWVYKFVGRPWDEMWSAIAHMPGKKFDIEHMKRHISYEFTNPDCSEKQMFFGRYYDDTDPSVSSFPALYVDEDGIIQKTRKPDYQIEMENKPEPEVTWLWMSANLYCEKIDGNWFSFIPKVVNDHICWVRDKNGNKICKNALHWPGKDAPKKIWQEWKKEYEKFPYAKFMGHYYNFKETSDKLAIKLTKKRQLSRKFIRKFIEPKLKIEE